MGLFRCRTLFCPKRIAALLLGTVVVIALLGFDRKHVSYVTTPAVKQDIEATVTAIGTLRPRRYVDVGAQVSGQIEEIFVEVGDVVKAGQELAKIDATTAEARVEQNRAQMAQSKTNLITAQANLEKSKRDYERQENLLKEDATTKEAVLNAKTTYENAIRSVETSKLSIAANEASQRIEENNLKYTTVVAPIAGTVMSIAVKKGQTLNATQSAPTVMRIADLNLMTVASDVSEADISRLYEGMPVYFTTLSSTRRWTSVLKRKEPTPKTQQGVVLFPALFDIANEGSTLMPSMSAQVYFIAAEARNVLKVPMAAIQQGQQISRELAAKERAAGKQPAAGTPGAAPGAPGPGAANPAAGAREGGSAPATAATTGGTTPATPAVQQGNNAQGNRQANAQGNGGGQRPNGQGGFNGGQRPGGQGGFGGQRPGGQGGFGNLTPEQIAEFRRMREQGGGGGFGGAGFNRQGMMGSSGASAGPRPAQRRQGTVMVKKEDGTMEPRRIVYGVSDRVFAEVIEGLKEGEEVVVGKRDTGTAAPRTNNNQNQNFNQNFRGGNNFQGGNFGGGRPF